MILFILVANQMVITGLKDTGSPPRITGVGLPAEFGLGITPSRPTTVLLRTHRSKHERSDNQPLERIY